MGDIHLRKYGVATTVDFALYATDGTALKTDAASASGDVTLYRDEAGVETLDADAFVDEGAIYSLALSAAEMQAARIIICVVDQTGPQAWLDKTIIVETYGNASAQHAFDLDTATQNVNVASVDNIDFGATMKTSLETAVDNGLDNAIGGAPTAGSVAERIKTLDDAYTATRAAYLDELAAANLPTDIAAVSAAIAALNDFDPAADTVALVTDITTKTGFSLSAAGIDSVWDEVMDTNAPANANTARKIINVVAAVLGGKSSGGGTNTNVFRDTGDTKNRVSATVDADGNRTAVGTLDGT